MLECTRQCYHVKILHFADDQSKFDVCAIVDCTCRCHHSNSVTMVQREKRCCIGRIGFVYISTYNPTPHLAFIMRT